jgi:hypothetical protein
MTHVFDSKDQIERFTELARAAYMLEVMRPIAMSGGLYDKDSPYPNIRRAWIKALEAYDAACAAWVEAYDAVEAQP